MGRGCGLELLRSRRGGILMQPQRFDSEVTQQQDRWHAQPVSADVEGKQSQWRPGVGRGRVLWSQCSRPKPIAERRNHPAGTTSTGRSQGVVRDRRRKDLVRVPKTVVQGPGQVEFARTRDQFRPEPR